ncbi:MAG: A/G-specific adenine glycosylase [Rhodospirillales bacterium]|nr:A/G-specific adenine glycosylase [Rhodospirillales bacterium]
MELLQTEKAFNPVITLLDWYDLNRRELPWRHAQPDPYHVWLSEVMLQQTTVVAVTPRYARFLERWPDIQALAEASLDDVLHEWQGLGYYARARNLHCCAQHIVAQDEGRFPDTEKALHDLPGVGDYTAAAIAAIAFGEPVAPVDGNVIRVISRLDALEQIMPTGKQVVQKRVTRLVPEDRPGDFAQAMMDLGAIVCTPRNPKCEICPWEEACKARAGGDAQSYPRKAPKKHKPTRYGVVFWLTDRSGRVMLRRREEKGLLGGMMEFPSTEWLEQAQSSEDVAFQAPVSDVVWKELVGPKKALEAIAIKDSHLF